MERSSLNTPSQITKKEKKRGRKRLLSTYCFVCAWQKRQNAIISVWVSVIGSGPVLPRPCWWEVMWEDQTPGDRCEAPASDFVAGVCGSSQKKSASNTWSGQVSPFWPLGALSLVVNCPASPDFPLDRNHLPLHTTESKRGYWQQIKLTKLATATISFISHLFLLKSICIHVSDHLSDELPKLKKQQKKTKKKNMASQRSETATEWEDRASTDEGSQALLARVFWHLTRETR